MSVNDFIPTNIDDFFVNLSKEKLFQGDIISAKEIGLKDGEDGVTCPDYYMIITKTCDLQFDNIGIFETRSGIINLIPLFNMKLLAPLFGKFLRNNVPVGRINLLPIMSIIKAFSSKSVDNINNLIQNKISKFMYLPPDGEVIVEPSVIDFELLTTIEGDNAEEVGKLLNAKKLQLNSPFREHIAQRFALHYSGIGIKDKHIKDKEYINKIKKLLKDHNDSLKK